MEARCYRGGDGRTKMNASKIVKKDVLLFIGNLVFFGMIVVVSKI